MEEKLDLLSVAYAWIIFTGFSIVPLSVMAQKYQIFESYDSTFFPPPIEEPTPKHSKK